MKDEERERALAGLALSETRVLALVKGLTLDQWEFHEAPGRWSIAEIVEHLAVFERFILGVVQDALAQPADLHRKAAAAEFSARNEGLVLGLAESRAAQQFKAREATSPNGRWAEPERIVAEFREARAATIALVEEMRGDPRDFFFAHLAFGDLDCYQWLLLLGTHCERHSLQIEEGTRNRAFPALASINAATDFPKRE